LHERDGIHRAWRNAKAAAGTKVWIEFRVGFPPWAQPEADRVFIAVILARPAKDARG
jgi:hypothetical protein